MSAGSAHHISLLDGQNAGRIGTGLKLRSRAIRAHGFDDKVRARATQKPAGIAAAGPETIVWTVREFAPFLHQLVAFDIRIQHMSGADFQSHFPANANGIDGDDGRSSGNAGALNGAQSHRAAADYSNDGAGLNR